MATDSGTRSWRYRRPVMSHHTCQPVKKPFSQNAHTPFLFFYTFILERELLFIQASVSILRVDCILIGVPLIRPKTEQKSGSLRYFVKSI